MTAAHPVDEDEVDLGRFGRALAQRWWLLVVGLVAGAIVGWLTTVGGTRNYRAQAVVYLGQPLGILGGSTVPSLNNNPSAARAIVTAESTIRRASARSGLTSSQLRQNTSVTAVAGANTKQGQTPLVQITVKGRQATKVREAANAFASVVVEQLSAYANTKIRTLEQEKDADEKAIEAINAALASSSVSLTDKLILQLQLTQRQSDATQATQLLSLARNVEAPRVVTHASATKTSARSHRNSAAVGGLIGLILGALAALLWDPFVRARRSSS
jgi:uncharacterized protein involved in exopolysaccharide biosynthesis